MKKRILRKTAAAAAAAALIAASPVISYANAEPEAEAEPATKFDDLVDSVFFSYWEDYVPEDDGSETEELPSKFDLRDVDGVCYVPEIRSQNPFGTCWSFGSIAAAEISLAYSLGVDFNIANDFEKAALDLSEKHLAWFSYTPLPEDSPFYPSQSGEGFHYKEYDEGIDTDEETRIPYNFGGHAHYAAVLFSEGVGPTFEADVPYINNEGKWPVTSYVITLHEDGYEEIDDYFYDNIEYSKEAIDKIISDYEKKYPGIRDYDTELDGPGKYYKISADRYEDGNWSVDESKRFESVFLKHSNILPAPATMGDSSQYVYNENATTAIKKELLSGKGVAVTMYSDHSMPGYVDDFDNAFLSFHTKDGKPAENMDEAAIWSHYTYCSGYDKNDPNSDNYCHSSNHVVCIVGYDDDFPKEYFYDPNGTIGGNGAWIARNSWGSKNNSDLSARYDWGNNGDGYFYISYYDQSLDSAESYEFESIANEDEARSLELYDLFPEFNYQIAVLDRPVHMANVFTADNDEIIRDVGIMTALPDLTARISVYLLSDGFKSPTDGKKVTGTEETFDYKGYHTTKLDDEIEVKKGQKYSVVLELLRGDGKYVFEINQTENKAGHDNNEKWRKEWYIEEHGSLEGYVEESHEYGKMVVNKGESWLSRDDIDTAEWYDLTDVIAAFDEINEAIIDGPYYDYDNFPIRSYPYSSILEVHNTVTNEKDIYDAGDVLEGTVTINNYSAVETYNNVEIRSSLFDFGDEGKIDVLEPCDSITINYSYTVTEEDLGKGTLTSDISVFIYGDQVFLNEKFSTLSFKVKVADKKPVVTEEPPPEEDGGDVGKPAETPSAKTNDFPLIPVIIIIALVVAAAVITVTIVLVRKKQTQTKQDEEQTQGTDKEEQE